MYNLENIGWKITQVGNSAYNGRYDFNIIHRIHAPLGMILQRKTIKEVVKYIEDTYLSPIKFMGTTIENRPRREYSFKYVHDQEQFAKLWNGVEVNSNTWKVLI